MTLTIRYDHYSNDPNDYRMKRLMINRNYPITIYKDGRPVKKILIENGNRLAWTKYVPNIHIVNYNYVTGSTISPNVQLHNIASNIRYYKWKTKGYISNSNGNIIHREEFDWYHSGYVLIDLDAPRPPQFNRNDYNHRFDLESVFGRGQAIMNGSNVVYKAYTRKYSGLEPFNIVILFESDNPILFGQHYNIVNNRFDFNLMYHTPGNNYPVNTTRTLFHVEGQLRYIPENDYKYKPIATYMDGIHVDGTASESSTIGIYSSQSSRYILEMDTKLPPGTIIALFRKINGNIEKYPYYFKVDEQGKILFRSELLYNRENRYLVGIPHLFRSIVPENENIIPDNNEFFFNSSKSTDIPNVVISYSERTQIYRGNYLNQSVPSVIYNNRLNAGRGDGGVNRNSQYNVSDNHFHKFHYDINGFKTNIINIPRYTYSFSNTVHYYRNQGDH